MGWLRQWLGSYLLGMETESKKYPRAEALAVAEEVYNRLKPLTHRCKVVGSLRRYRAEVKDVEILFIPQYREGQRELFLDVGNMVDLADQAIEQWVLEGFLAKRLNVNDSPTWGPLNKLCVHVKTGIPVDLFATSEENWWNSLVCRTGSANSNKRLAAAALAKGWTFEAYGPGFRRLGSNEYHRTTSEEDVFKFAGLPYLAPQYRS